DNLLFMDAGFVIIAGSFLIYVFLLFHKERKILSNTHDIIDKFLAFLLLYSGISIIYYSITGEPFLNDSEESYSVYLFIMGFIALIWSVPTILSEFTFFKKYLKKK